MSKKRTELDEALAAWQAGNVEEAGRLARKAARKTPGAWGAAYLLGLVAMARGQAQPARGHFEQAARLNPAAAEPHLALADLLRQTGEPVQAAEHYRAGARLAPANPLPHFNLGLIGEAAGDAEAAAASYARAIELKPDFPEAWNNLGNLQRAAGDIAAAEASYRRAAELRPGFAEAWDNLGVLYDNDFDDVRKAAEYFERAVQANADFAQAHFHLGVLATRDMRTERALAHYEKALQLNPDHADAYANLGMVFFRNSLLAEAEECYRRALRLNPDLAEAHNNLGLLLARRERFEEALACYRKALAINPRFAEAHFDLGLCLAQQGDLENAIAAFLRAFELRDGGYGEAAAQLGKTYQAVGDLEQARTWLRRAHELTGWDILRLHEATLLPPFMESATQIREMRARMASELEALQASGPVFTEREMLECPDTGFYLAYHGLNDCELQRRIAAIHIQACPSLAYVAPHVTRTRAAHERIRIAFVSRFLYNHSVGNFFNPIIQHLCGLPEFEVLLFSIGSKEDEVFADLARACTGHVRLAADSLVEARRAIAEAEPDILVYPEIGMDPFTYLLAFSRLGRVQCVLHGHSATTGIPNVDDFISSALMEPTHGQEGYTERLVCLPTLFMYLAPHELDDVPAHRAAFAASGLPATGTLYLCPMKLQKIHPDMDTAFGEILRRDPQAWIILIEDHDRPVWRERLAERLTRKLPDVFERVIFLPWIGQKARFASLIKSVDVVLDSFHHGGATTAHIALATGTPIVSWLTQAARPHIVKAYYTLMGIEGCIADTPEGFVDLALRLGRDAGLRARIGEEIRRNRHKLYDNDGVFAAYAGCFRQMAGEARRVRPLGAPYIPLVSVKQWCAASGQRYEVLEPPRPLTIRGATFFGATDMPAETATSTPEIWLAELHEVSIIGGHGVILAQGGTKAIIEEPEFDGGRVQVADDLIYHRLADQVLLNAVAGGMAGDAAGVKAGVWLAGKGSTNYYHWLLEYLPRLSLLDRHPEYDSLPLIIDAGLHPNLLAALEQVNLKRRPLIEIESSRCYAMHRLVVPSRLVKMPFDYRPGARVFDDDVVFSPAAIDYLRRAFAHFMTGAEGAAWRRIYVPRRGAKYRELLNEAEIMALFETEGYEIVYPEKLSFEEQVRLFSEAAVIAGPSGAGMTNILFAPKEAITLMLSYRDDRVEIPYLVFSNLAQALGQEMVFVLGEPAGNALGIAYQSDYVVPLDLIRQAFKQVKAKQRLLEELKGDEPIRIAFIVQYPSVWPSWRSVWQAANSDKRFSVMVVVSRFIHPYASEAETFEEMRKLLTEEGVPHCLESECDLESFSPHVVFIQNPYETTRPAQFSLAQLTQAGSLIAYIPYGLEIGGGSWNLNAQFDTPLHNAAWRIFARSERHKAMFAKYCRKGNSQVVVTGHPKFDAQKSAAAPRVPSALIEKIAGRKVVLWTPHFTVGTGLKWSTFDIYGSYILEEILRRQELFLLLRPHPLFFKTMLEQNVWNEEGERIFRETVEGAGNIALDENADYSMAFSVADALMADAGSFLLEFLPTLKPILYLHCADGEGLNDDGELIRFLYAAFDKEDISGFLDRIATGQDPKRQQRIAVLPEFLYGLNDESTAGERICEHLYRALSNQSVTLPGHPNGDASA